MIKKILLISFLFLYTQSKAFADNDLSNLIRNPVLESMEVDKKFVAINHPDKFNNKNKKQVSKKKAEAAAKDMEGVFLAVMMEPLFPKGNESNLYGGGKSSDIFRSMVLQQYGKNFADAGGIGLKKGIMKQLQ